MTETDKDFNPLFEDREILQGKNICKMLKILTVSDCYLFKNCFVIICARVNNRV
ncbi:hypothetical protein C1G86_1244 [Dehalococcoides mccartyi]|uniref:Uncharacterized protein n=2 Tax=Dehalococcoides mccartyi TaxID=61435 RepID=A0A328ENM5_9CHLR|nr:hypothetical protein C1G87_1204 [Dehalococcoides mccartyi]RAL70338.1 hypothetical protein C1G86_1244 [Dehalococcoides mccartyi]CAI83356.1 hypothetical protein cbdbA1299 [Dehalococcoides mccartyi CBDB1]